MDLSHNQQLPRELLRSHVDPNLRLPGDDWTGVTDNGRRKRLQNRLNQRAWRTFPYLRLLLALRRGALTPAQPSGRRQKTDVIYGETSHETETYLSQSRSTQQHSSWILTGQVPSQSSLIVQPHPSRNELRSTSLPIDADDRARIDVLIRQSYHDYTHRKPNLRSLPLLIRLNALDAIAHNADKLGISSVGLCCETLLSPFTPYGPRQIIESSTQSAAYPPGLQPTAHQRTISHHPWIDLLPSPGIRSNILVYLNAGLIDDAVLCEDIMGVEDDDPPDRLALIVWGNPSDWASWEVNVGFLKR